MFVHILFLIATISGILYLLVTARYKYWKRRHVPGPVPSLFGGNIRDFLSQKTSLADIFTEIYRKYRNYPFVGIYQIFTPTVLLIDLDVIKTVLVKDFVNFGENTLSFSDAGSLLEKNPFVLKISDWKCVRQQFAPLLSNSKLRSTVECFNKSAEEMTKYIKNKIKFCTSITLEAKELASRYTASNVTSWGLGIEAEGFKDDTSDMVKLAKQIFQLSFLQNISFLIGMIFPALGPFLNTRILSPSAEKSIISIIKESLQYRSENTVDRNDFIGALLSLKSAGTLSEKNIISYIGSLFVDGIDTSANVLHFVLYELAANPEVQEMLKKEIDDSLASTDNYIVSFDTIQEMKYLDAVFNETLRLHLVLPFMSKQTTTRCTLKGRTNNDQLVETTLDVGTTVIIPTCALHMDERYFPNPSTFNPERFFGKNKQNIPKFSFLPFGEGPRVCLGRMFGMYQVKMGIVYLIKNFKVSLGDGTTYPVQLDLVQFIPTPKEPIKLKFQARD